MIAFKVWSLCDMSIERVWAVLTMACQSQRGEGGVLSPCPVPCGATCQLTLWLTSGRALVPSGPSWARRRGKGAKGTQRLGWSPRQAARGRELVKATPDLPWQNNVLLSPRMQCKSTRGLYTCKHCYQTIKLITGLLNTKNGHLSFSSEPSVAHICIPTSSLINNFAKVTLLFMQQLN